MTNNESSWPTFYIPRNNVHINLSTTIYCNGLIYTYHIFRFLFRKIVVKCTIISTRKWVFFNCCYSLRINQNQYRWRICWRCWHVDICLGSICCAQWDQACRKGEYMYLSFCAFYLAIYTFLEKATHTKPTFALELSLWHSRFCELTGK